MSSISKYIQEIERKLEQFKTAREWSDFMTHLANLVKLLSNMPHDINPTQLPVHILNKRLNQCLTPSLPAGVHNEVIHVYSILLGHFNRYISQTHDLNLIDKYVDFLFVNVLPGIFTFSRFSKIQSKALYYTLIDTQLLTLNAQLDPYIRNILLGLFPGMEEDTDVFYQCNTIILNFYNIVNKHSFWNHLWNVYLLCPTHRISIINFLSKNQNIVHEFNRKEFNRNEKRLNKTPFHFLSETMVISSIKAGLRDKNTMIIRGTLDILTMFFDIQQLSEKNQVALLEDLCLLFIYRDIALNKRIDNFIDKDFANLHIITERNDFYKIGIKTKKEKSISYDYLTIALEGFISKDSNNLILFFKILNIIHDKDELSDYLLRMLLMKGIIAAYKIREKQGIENIVKQFDILLSNIDCWYIWFLIFDYSYTFLAKESKIIKIPVVKSKDDIDLNNNEVYRNRNKSHDNLSTINMNSKSIKNTKCVETEGHKSENDNPMSNHELLVHNTLNNSLTMNTHIKTPLFDYLKKAKNTNDEILDIIIFILKETILGTEETTKTHFINIIILVLKNSELFTHGKLVSFIIDSSVFIIPEVRGVKRDFQFLIDKILNFYNEDNEKQLEYIVNSYICTLGETVKGFFDTNLNFHENMRLFMFYIDKYGLESIGDEFMLEYYNYLCIFIVSCANGVNEILQKSLVLFRLIKDEIVFDKLIGKSEKIFMILLEQDRFYFICEYNLLFKRSYELLIVDIFNRNILLQNILNHLTFCIGNCDRFYFFNLLVVINEYFRNCSLKEENLEADHLKQAILNFLIELHEFDNIFSFCVNLIINSSIENKNDEYIDTPNISNIITSFRLINTFLDYTSEFLIYMQTDNNKIYNFLSKYGTGSSMKPSITTYILLLHLVQVNHPEIQILSLDLINTFYRYNIINPCEISKTYYYDMFSFIARNYSQVILNKLIPTISLLNHSPRADLPALVYDYLHTFNIKRNINNNVISLLHSFEQDIKKNMLLKKFSRETDSLYYKYRIFIYINNSIPDFESNSYHEIIQDIIEALFKTSKRIFERKSCSIDLTGEDVKLEKLMNEISQYLISNCSNLYMSIILKHDPTSSYFRLTSIRKEIYNQLFVAPNISYFSFLATFEDFMRQSELLEFYEYAFERVINFYINQRNKVTIPEFYLWYLKKIRNIDELPNRWFDCTFKIFESINLLLSKIISHALKKYSTKEEKDLLTISILESTQGIITKLDHEKYRAVIQGFVTIIFNVLKANDGKKYDIALLNLYDISKDSRYIKFYKSDFIEYFYDNKFFIDTRNNLEIKISILKTIVAQDHRIVVQVFDYFEPQKFFKLKDNDLSQRSHLLHRLSLLFFCSSKEQLSNYIPICFEKMVDSINSNSISLKKDVYFLVRQIVFKTDPNKLLILWPTIISDMNLFFERIINNRISVDDFPLLLEIIKTLEVLFIYKNDNFIEFKWACTETYDCIDDLDPETKGKYTQNEYGCFDKNEIYSPLLLQEDQTRSHFTRIARFIKQIKDDYTSRIPKPKMTLPVKREPLMVINSINSLRDLLYTFENLSLYHKNMDLVSNEINEEKLCELSINDFLNCDRI